MSAGNIKGILFLIAAPFLSWMLIQRGCEQMGRPPESAPTAIRAEQFAHDYKGQAWLEVDGKWATHYGWSARTPNSKYNEYTSVFVPVVPADWKPADPVHVIAVFAAPSVAAARDWPARHAGGQRRSVTGSVAPKGVWDYKRMFPDLSVTEPIVFLYEGQVPESRGEGAFSVGFGIFILALAVGVVLIPYLWGRRQARRQRAFEARWGHQTRS